MSISFFIFIGISNAQEYPIKFKHLSIEHGLSEVNARCILQDRNGFLWIGTQDGLNRYDGYDFVIYKNNPLDSNSITGNFINCLYEDSGGILWIGTLGGLTSYNPADGKFTQYKPDANNKNKIQGNNIISLCGDNNGFIWIGTYSNGVSIFDKKKNRFTTFLHNPDNQFSLSSNSITSLLKDKTGTIWLGTNNGGLNKYIGDISYLNNAIFATDKFEHFLYDPDKNSICTNTINYLSQDSSNNILIGTPAGLTVLHLKDYLFENLYFDISSNSIINYEKSMTKGNNIISVFCDNSNNIWLGTMQEGLISFKREIGKFSFYKKNDLNPVSINNNNVFSIFEDINNILWIGTGKGGINKLDKKSENFHSMTKISGNISDNSIGAIYEDTKGNLWLGTDDGLNKLDAHSGSITKYYKGPVNTNSLSNNKVTAITEDVQGNIWIGTRSGLNKFVPALNKFSRFISESDSHIPGGKIFFNGISDLYFDHTGTLWIGTVHGLIKYDTRQNKFFSYQHNNADSNSLSDDTIVHIYEDGEESIWVCADLALNKFDQSTGKFTRYSFKNNFQYPKFYFSLYEDPEHYFWIGTDAGLIKFDPRNNAFEIYSMKNGIKNNIVYSILPDNRNNLWISSLKSISKFDLRTKSFTNYSPPTDGYNTNEYNSRSFFRSKSGTLYFGGVNGLIYFHPDSIKENLRTPQVAITHFKIFDKDFIENKYFTGSEIINLTHSQNFLSFEFSALDFTDPAKNLYAYYMEGVDTGWVYSGSRRYVSYTQLNPGEYNFRVKASNSDGIWNENGISIAIIITPPYWQTWWFKTILIFWLLMLIYFFYRSRINKLKKERNSQKRFSNLLIESQEKERSRIASELHDSVGQNLILIKNHALLGINSNKKESNIEQLDKISELSSQTITDVREISYNLRPHQLGKLGLTKTIHSLINRIKSGIAINFSVDTDDIDNKLTAEEEIHFYRIIQECINNTIKHSRAGNAVIEIKTSPHKLFFDYSDDGIGFDKSKLNDINGMGFLDLSERVNILKGTINISSEINKGTRISISIPIQETNNEKRN